MIEMAISFLMQEIDDMLCEEYWPRHKVEKWIEIAKIYEKEGNQQGVEEIKQELNLLNRTYLAPPNEITDVWKWCLDHLNDPFPSWKSEAVEYYMRRSDETKNPLNRARYAYALWTLEKKIEYGKLSVESFIQAGEEFVVKKCYSQGTSFITNAFCFEFAARLSLALNLPKPSFIEVVSSLLWAINELQKEKIRGRGMSDFVHTMASLAQDVARNPKIRENKDFGDIVKETRKISGRIAEEWHKQKDFGWQRFYLEDCVTLSRFLRDEEEAKKTLLTIAESYIEEGREKSASKMVEQHFYEEALEIYANLGIAEKIGDMKNKISQCEREAIERGEYKLVMTEAEIPIDEFAKMYVEKLKGPPQVILRALVDDPQLITSKRKVVKYTQEIAKKYPLQFIFPTKLMGRDGPIESFNTEQEIFEYKVREEYNLESQISEVVITRILNLLLQERLQPSDIFNFISSGRNIDGNMKKMIEMGLKAHFDKNYVCSVTILIPQIEELLRNVLRRHGITPTKYDQRKGGIEQTLLGTLVDEIEPIVGEDFAEYLRIRLTVAFANIRNKVCHGWMLVEEFKESLSVALIFMILKLCDA